MLLASGATILFTTGLALYDFFNPKQKKLSEDGKDKKRNYQTIKLLLTGGPYVNSYLDAEAKVKG